MFNVQRQKRKHCPYKPGSVPALLPVPAIYLLRTSPCASSVLPSIAARPTRGRTLGRATLGMSMVYMNLQPPAGTARRSPVGWWSLTHAFSPLPLPTSNVQRSTSNVQRKRGAVVLFFPYQLSPTASTFRSGAPCAARTFLPRSPCGQRQRQSQGSAFVLRLSSVHRKSAAKVRISNRKAKEKQVFLCFSERKYIQRSHRLQQKGLNRQAIKTFFGTVESFQWQKPRIIVESTPNRKRRSCIPLVASVTLRDAERTF